MLNSPSLQTRKPLTRSLDATSRSSVIAQVPATQKLPPTAAQDPRPHYFNASQPKLRLTLTAARSMGDTSSATGAAASELGKPELLRYLGGGCKLCTVCGQQPVSVATRNNGICAGCNAKIQGALASFKRHQVPHPCSQVPCSCSMQAPGSNPPHLASRRSTMSGKFDTPYSMGNRKSDPRYNVQSGKFDTRYSMQSGKFDTCNCTASGKSDARYSMTSGESDLQFSYNEQEYEEQEEAAAPAATQTAPQAQPFNIIVLQDCNNHNLIDQLTAALTVSCQQQNAYNNQPPECPKMLYSPQPAYSPNYFNNNPHQSENNSFPGQIPQGGIPSAQQYCCCPPVSTGQQQMPMPQMGTPSSPNSLSSQSSASNPEAGKCCCTCEACRMKLPQLVAQALEIFLMSHALKEEQTKKAASATASSSSMAVGGKEKRAGEKAKGKPKRKANDRTMDRSNDKLNGRAKDKTGDKSKEKPADKSKEKAADKTADKSAAAKPKRKKKSNWNRRKEDSLFYLPQSNNYCGQPRCVSCCLPGCAAPCNMRCPGGRQGNFSVAMAAGHGAGDQPNRGNCQRACGRCASCPNCPTTRDTVHPVAHFRPGQLPYPQSCMLQRNGDFVRRSLVRTAAGVTVHEVHRQEDDDDEADEDDEYEDEDEQEEHEKESPRQHQLKFQCANCPCWR